MKTLRGLNKRTVLTIKIKKFRVPKLFGLAFDSQEVDRLTAQPWDVPVDGIVTPTRFIR